MNTSHKLILGASAVVFAAGTVVAIVQPGDLGDDDVASIGATTTTLAPSTTSLEASTTTLEDIPTTTEAAVATTIPGSGTSTTEAPTTTTTLATTTTVAGATTTTTVGSGLGAEGGGTVNPDGTVADTGMESMLPLGLALGALALAGRRLLRPSQP